MAASPPASARWLFGPVPDLLLGCGGLYLCVLLAFSIGGAELRAAEAAWLGPLLVLILGAPHYGATLVRVYEHRADRRAYVVFSLYASIAIAAAFAASLFSWTVATWLVTIYLTWSPWHYTGQNYGLAVMFLRRRGVAVSPPAKRLLYASFMLSYGLTFLVFHGDIGLQPVPEFATGPRSMFVAIGLPAPFMAVAFPLLAVAYAVSLGAAAVLLLRGGSARDLLPSAVMVLTQALWFTVPMLLLHWRVPVGVEPFAWQLRDYYFFWIALGHSTQYLWVTTYYAHESEGWRSYGRYLTKVLVAGTAIWTMPVILLDPARVGSLPNTAALTLLVASAVNIHHFVLDGAIWKLRNSRVASVLIRRDDAPSPDTATDATPGLLRRAVWTVAAVGSCLALFQYLHKDVLFPLAVEQEDYTTARSVLERLAWINEISDGAWKSLDRAAAGLEPPAAGSAPGYGAPLRPRTAHALAARGDWPAAARTYEALLAGSPDNPALLLGAGRAWIELDEPERAIPHLERLRALQPDDDDARQALAYARRMAASPARP